MSRSLMAYVLVSAAAAAAFAAAPAFAAGEADSYQGPTPVVSQRSRAEVHAEALVAAQRAADPDTLSRIAAPVKSALSRTEVRQAAAAANRAGLVPNLNTY